MGKGEEKQNLDLFVLSEDKKSEAFQIAAICYLKTKSESLSLAKEEIGLHGHSCWEKPISLSRKMGHGPTSEDTKDFQFWVESKTFLAVKCHKQ
ncbi:hypothetical protein CEXT_696651 [Caerostris extrusa]|uniref:Uncharacterized protein n=1 Tax=Caerostris extrusa TaxID=172846 RepID=A0AAV4P6J7_CAEEX|nr:hypothetical protein CEXT_696651 [Caerostris extrusa]